MSSTASRVSPVWVSVRFCGVQVLSRSVLPSALASVVLVKSGEPVGDVDPTRGLSPAPSGSVVVLTVKVGPLLVGVPGTSTTCVTMLAIVIFIRLLRMTNGKCCGKRTIVVGPVVLVSTRWKTSGNSLLKLNARTRPRLLPGLEIAARMLLSWVVMLSSAPARRMSPPSRAV